MMMARLGEFARGALEAFGIEEYKSGRINKRTFRQLLGLETSDQLDTFLKAHAVWIEYDMADLEREREGLRRLGL
ncbi:MAG: hypothetical protein JO307_30565 [Bryobacterales bacterium]|nr:hypothetical protein [Bryobacterales bacterium]MBV9400736.1 hypothetical protein [Bryobacterales bacterium]